MDKNIGRNTNKNIDKNIDKMPSTIATIPVRFCVMGNVGTSANTNTTTTTNPGAYLRNIKPRTFVRVESLPGSNSAARSALSYAARKGDLVRVRKGLYYKGSGSRYGMTRPSRVEVARQVLGTKGVGPAGFSAARHLGLTTQLASEFHVAVAGPVPDAISGVRVHKRNNLERRSLNETEIAVLEVLRDPSTYVEGGWPSLVKAVERAVARKDIRLSRMGEAIPSESSRSVKDNYLRLTSTLSVS